MWKALPRGKKNRNNPWLDLVRGIAILLVLLRHGERALQTVSQQPLGALETIFVNGWIGVDLFFVLSGYLIARHLITAGIGSETFRLGRYLAMRGLRIIPAYLAVLVLIVVGAFPLYVIAQEGLPFRIAYHLLFLQDYLPSNINVVFWSLGVEEKFYLLAPVLVLVLLRCRTGVLQTILLLVLFIVPVALRAASFLRLPAGIEYDQFFFMFRSPFHLSLEGLIVGVAIAIAQHSGLIRPSRKSGLIGLLLSMAVLFIWLASHNFLAEISAFDAIVQPSIIAVVAGAMTLGSVQLGKTGMPFSRPITMLSRLSYSLYLIHFPLIPLITAISAPGGKWAFWVCYLASSFAAAVFLHLLVERPFLLWKDRLSARGSDVSRDATNERPPKELMISGS